MKYTKVIKFPRLSARALGLLDCLLAPIALALIYTASYTASLSTYDAARYYPVLAVQMEHILMSLLLAVGGVLLFDIVIKGH